jgi:RNA polymerase sigma factor (TIGR02999 family)
MQRCLPAKHLSDSPSFRTKFGSFPAFLAERVAGNSPPKLLQSWALSRIGGATMNNVTQILSQVEQGDPSAAEQLLPLVYDELRKLAATNLAKEKPGQTLQATALVHEAYLRLVDVDTAQHWNSRGHFYVAAAEAMRRILVESARRKGRQKHGGDHHRVELLEADGAVSTRPDELLAVDEALTKLSVDDPLASNLVKLRYFAGLSVEEAANSLGIPRATAYRHWTYARAWIRCEILGDQVPESS